MKDKDIVLICKNVIFYSSKDEEAFFEWIKKIKVIERSDSGPNELYLYVKEPVISDEDLDNLIGLFFRYKVDMKQLSCFLTDDNKSWFYDNKKAFWYEQVFG